MYTIISTGILVFLIMSCIFYKKRTSLNIRLLIGIIFFVSAVVASTLITYHRLPDLETRIESKFSKLSYVTIHEDIRAFKYDSIIEDSVKSRIIYSQVDISDTMACRFDTISYYSYVINIDTMLCVVNYDDELIYIKPNANIYLDTIDAYYTKSEEYIPDKWSSLFIPSKSKWNEIHLTQTAIDEARQLYPKLTNLWNILK